MSVVARYAFLLVALAYEVFLGNAAGQAIQNGDFEDVTIGSESSSMPSDVPGWTHSGSVGDHLLWRTGYSDPDGSVVRAGRGAQFVTLGGGYWARGSASWSTTISGLRPGRWYELSFMISNENQRKEPLTLSVSFPSGAAAAPRSFSAKASTGYWSAWEFEEQTFRATQATAVVMFSVDNQRYDIGLDNVSVRSLSHESLPKDLPGTWLDTNGVLHTLAQSGVDLTWHFESGPLYHGRVDGPDFEVRPTSDPNVTRTSLPFERLRGHIRPDGSSIELTGYLRGGATWETTLVRVLNSSSRDRPAKLWIMPEKPSTLSGLPIRAQVVVKTGGNFAVIADRDYRIQLHADEATLSDSQITIPAGRPSASFTITGNRPGQSEIRAESDPPLVSTSRPVFTCEEGQIRDIELSSGQSHGRADWTPLNFVLKFTDGAGHLMSDRRANTITLKRQGVGSVDRNSIELPGDECVSERNIESEEPGSANVAAERGGRSASADFFFYLPLTFALFLLVGVGGLGGGLIRAAADYTRRRSWRIRRTLIDGAAGILTGIAVFLGYYYGLLQIVPRVSGGTGLAFLLGIFGGYLGPVAMNRMSRLVFAGPREAGSKAHPAGKG